ncbi:hypothetical protein GCM10023085_50340 [Actinomadura viridis]|uniref:GNAT superfamily N-acetyltransferase n=1 Tax=Actinomadura viridis TaxID=58110 RepID=A0A931DJK9_9ACTN|nr:GNAT family N-acetyltransferase [Actinomadura viridis]MBG6092384.1 GNAT superfamily N-acetyltransferase [Actinomadura viridis]
MPDLIQLSDRSDVTPGLRRDLVDCWVQVTRGGGAAGFPFPPVAENDLAPVLDALIARLRPDRERLLVALHGTVPVGWAHLSRDPNPLIPHWGAVNHLQTLPTHRKRGVGTALMNHARDVARDEMGLRRLHLSARSGMGLETFYERLGWREAGRWAKALPPAPDGTLDGTVHGGTLDGGTLDGGTLDGRTLDGRTLDGAPGEVLMVLTPL